MPDDNSPSLNLVFEGVIWFDVCLFLMFLSKGHSILIVLFFKNKNVKSGIQARSQWTSHPWVPAGEIIPGSQGSTSLELTPGKDSSRFVLKTTTTTTNYDVLFSPQVKSMTFNFPSYPKSLHKFSRIWSSLQMFWSQKGHICAHIPGYF